MNEQKQVSKWRRVLADLIIYILTMLMFVLRIGYALVFLCLSVVIVIPMTTISTLLKKDISLGKAFIDAFECCLQEFDEIIKY